MPHFLPQLTKSPLWLGIAAFACVSAGDGVDPPAEQVYFPVGLSVDAAGDWLFVVNSDFDLQFNQGTVQSLSVEAIDRVVRQPCRSDADCSERDGRDQICDDEPTEQNSGDPSFFCVAADGPLRGLPCGDLVENSQADKALSPGRCGPVQPSGLVGDVVEISAFATASLLVQEQGGEGRERLFVPVRGDSSVHWLDVEEGVFDCGQDEEAGQDAGRGAARCSDAHKITSAPAVVEDPEDDEDDEILVGPEPFDIAATSDGQVLIVTHQEGARASIVLNDWSSDAPRLAGVETSGYPRNPMNVAAVPRPAVVGLDDIAPDDGALDRYQEGFLMTTRSEARVHLLRFFDDGLTTVLGADDAARRAAARPRLLDVGSSPIATNSGGVDSRGIAIDDSKRRTAEQACTEGDEDCLRAAAAVPLEVYVANRSPNSLLLGTTDSRDSQLTVDDLPTFHDNIPLTAGPSRVVLGRIMNPQGEYERRVFVICFDSALIYVFDPERRIVESTVFTGRGPHALAFHRDKPLAYVAHFTDSYVGVVSLDGRFPRTFGATVAMIGTPTPPRASK